MRLVPRPPARSHITVLGHVDRWLVRHRHRAEDLDDDLVEAFVEDQKGHGHWRRNDSAALNRFVGHLRAHGVVHPRALVVDHSLCTRLCRDYEQHLIAERGLAPVTLKTYGGSVVGFCWSTLARGRWSCTPLRPRPSPPSSSAMPE